MSDPSRKPRRVTHVEVINADTVRIVRAMTPRQRLGTAFSLWSSARRRVTQGVRYEHPDWDGAKVNAEVVRRMLASGDDRPRCDA